MIFNCNKNDDTIFLYYNSFFFLFFYSQFGCFNSNGSVIVMRDQLFYKNDSFGLLTMDSQKKIDIVTLSGLDHSDWHTNMSVLDNYIIPYLD